MSASRSHPPGEAGSGASSAPRRRDLAERGATGAIDTRSVCWPPTSSPGFDALAWAPTREPVPPGQGDPRRRHRRILLAPARRGL